ncbi:hypothetical protein EJ04DRAFT_507452 [Polyplosphaeria fusca]|uniref:Uncharacterized protein n=1 Tax=Polyplosphaeria fusca TaxID=682080 RepID=A0A9P4R870_9PLEO|nr:hypothetical protein EJ04DRAFT_507452 [Polyplosphaeria fusca]
MSSNMFSTIKRVAKDHHQSVNSAYQVYYSGGASPRPSTDSRTSSQSSTSSTSSTSSNMSKAWGSVKKAAKDHHQSVNSAYQVYYSGGPAPKQSSEMQRAALIEKVDGGEKRESGVRRSLEAVKKAVKEHHQSVSGAYEVYYSGGRRWEA